MRSVQLYQNLPGFKNLTAEQKVTALRWDFERLLRKGLFYKLRTMRCNADKIKVLDEIQGTIVEFCEHGIDQNTCCEECDDIEDICLGLMDEAETKSLN